jgi:hypothetical protein
MEAFNRWLREVIPPIAVIVALDLAITVIFLVLSGATARIGTLRPVGTIPAKGLELVLVGAAVGFVACVTELRIDLSLLTLAIAFVGLIDADHLPSALGIAQPIRPAHTFAFLAVEVVVLAIAFRRRPELPLLAVAAWFGHIAGDTGEFALFAPFSFDYSPLGDLRVPFVIVSAVFALATGYMVRRRKKRAFLP